MDAGSSVTATSSCICDSAWCFVAHLYDTGGAPMLCLMFVSFVFYRLVWRVWQAAMDSKEREMQRLVAEKSRLLALVIPGRQPSNGLESP